MTELDYALILCSMLLGGEVEQREYYDIDAGTHYVRTDCQTETHVFEVGLDQTRSAYDSLHQALFAASRTGKIPVIVIVDRDGREDNAQYQVETVARAAGVAYHTYTDDLLVRWQMTWALREMRAAVVGPRAEARLDLSALPGG